MAISISQMISVSYPEVLAEKRKPSNLWGESAAMRALESMGMIERVNGSPVYEVPLDYAQNAGTIFQTAANDLVGVSTSKTDVLTSAQYATAQLQVPIVWSKKDEAENSSPNQKVALVKSLLDNAINSHDDAIENALFDASTNGFVGLPGLLNETDGTGVIGGIDTTDIPFWKNIFHTSGWDDANTIIGVLTDQWNKATLGSGSSMAPKLLLSDAATQAVYESKLQGNIRYMDTKEADGGFKSLVFKTAKWVFSQYGTDTIYMLGPSFKLMVVKQAFRLMGDTIEFPDAAGYIRKLFTLAQTKTNNRRRLVALKK